MTINSLSRLGARQHGVLTIEQAATLGFTRADWKTMQRDGLLVPLFPSVSRLSGAPDTALATIKAATLAVGPAAPASHPSAAVAWGAPCIGIEPVHLSVADRNRRNYLSGIVLHRPRDVVDLDPVVRQRIPTTRPLRTLVDLGAVAPNDVLPVLRHFIATGVLPPVAVSQALREHRRKGRRGVTALEAALADLALGSKPPDSWLEETMAQLFVAHRLPPFEFHAVLCGYEVDFLVTGTPVVVETDGWESHGLQRHQFEGDREKDAVLGEAGYIVRRFTWKHVTRRPAWVAERIRGMLRRWAPDALAS